MLHLYSQKIMLDIFIQFLIIAMSTSFNVVKNTFLIVKEKKLFNQMTENKLGKSSCTSQATLFSQNKNFMMMKI